MKLHYSNNDWTALRGETGTATSARGRSAMYQMLTVGVLLAACIAGYWFPRLAWSAVGLLDLFFLGQLFVVRSRYKLDHNLMLSEAANAFAAKYGHYFLMPFASRDFSASSATVQFGGLALAVVTWFAEFKLGALFAVANWLLMGYVATSFSPAAPLAKYPELRLAHDEVMEFVQERSEHGRAAE